MLVAYDSETSLIKPGVLAPRLACGSFAWQDGRTAVMPAHATISKLQELLKQPDTVIVGQNVAYDFAVAMRADPSLDFAKMVFAAYSAGRVCDTKIREQLLDILDGSLKPRGYGLKDLAKKYLSMELDKTTWRTGYGPLIEVPFDDWPDGAIEYARGDAVATLGVHNAQQDRAKKLKYTYGDQHLVDELAQCRAAFALHLAGVWGARTDPAMVADVLTQANKERDALVALLKKAGIMDKDGKRSMALVRELVKQHYPSTLPQTAKGEIKTTREVLQMCKHPTLDALAKFSELDKLVGTYGPVLTAGTAIPINPSWQVLVETGRTSCREPNFQNLPREGKVRECFVPRSGYSFVAGDYAIAELCSLAQTTLDMFGKSAMAKALQDGKELHLDTAASILGISYDEAVRRRKEPAVKEARQLAKAANFGLPGGLGADSFVQFAYNSYGLTITRKQAEKLKKDWLKKYPEMVEYFELINSIVGPEQNGRVPLKKSRRIRGGTYFTNACNCVDYDTEALSDRGWLRGDQIRMTDRLLTKNPNTGFLEWQHPTDIKLFPEYSGETIEFKSRSFSAVTTPNHRWLVDRKSGAKNVCLTSETLSPHGDDRIHRTGDYSEAAVYSDDFVELVGWVLTDGSFDKVGNSTRVKIYQSERANPQKSAMIDSLMNRICPKHKRGHCRELYVWNFTGPLALQIREMFPHRQLTFSFLQQISKPQAQLLYKTMLLGDGNRTKNQEFLATKSKQTADAFQLLCHQIGYSSRLEWRDMSKYRPVSKYLKNIPNMTGYWHIRVLKRQRVQVTKAQTTTRKDVRGVWCPVVPNTFFVARRNGTTYVTGNTFFQGLTADGAKAALYEVSRECYSDPQSPLYRSRVVFFVHDEIILEVPAANVTEAAKRLQQVMCEQMALYTPDIPVTAKPHAMLRWHKNAEAIWQDGQLIPWLPPLAQQQAA